MSQRAELEVVLEALDQKALQWVPSDYQGTDPTYADGVRQTIAKIREALKATAIPAEEARADALVELGLRARKTILVLAAQLRGDGDVTTEDLMDALNFATEIRPEEG